MRFKEQTEYLLERSRIFDSLAKRCFEEADKAKYHMQQHQAEMNKQIKKGTEAAEEATRFATAAIVLQNT